MQDIHILTDDELGAVCGGEHSTGHGTGPMDGSGGGTGGGGGPLGKFVLAVADGIGTVAGGVVKLLS